MWALRNRGKTALGAQINGEYMKPSVRPLSVFLHFHHQQCKTQFSFFIYSQSLATETVDRLIHSFSSSRRRPKSTSLSEAFTSLAPSMQSFTIAAGVLSAISSIPAVSAHGYVANVVTGGQTYDGASPNWIYGDKPDQAGWYAYNQDNGYVPPSQYKSVNISCHKGATPGTTYIPVTAGDTVDFMWNTWPDSHKGPILTYMASCNGDCTAKQNASSLDWFKVEAKGLLDPSANEWATDKLISMFPKASQTQTSC